MKHSIIACLCISSIILSLHLQAFPGTSLLPQWRVGQLPKFTGKTVDDAHAEHFCNYLKNVASFTTIGSAIGAILGMLSYERLATQPRSIAITIPLFIYSCCLGTGLYCAFRSPRSRSLLNRLNLLKTLKNRVSNIALTQQSVHDALDQLFDSNIDNMVSTIPEDYRQYVIDCYKEIARKHRDLSKEEKQALKERYGSRYVQEEEKNGLSFGNLKQQRIAVEGRIIFLHARAIYWFHRDVNYFLYKDKNEIQDILEQERLACEASAPENAQQS